MKILYWLYRSHINSKGLTPIMMWVTVSGKRLNIQTDISIPEKSWDQTRQLIKGSDDLTRKYNQLLLTLKSRAWEYYNESLKQNREPDLDGLKHSILGKNEKRHTLLETIGYHISQLRSRVGNDIAPATVKKYETLERKLTEYLQQEKKRDDITLDQLSHQFIQEFDVFMRVKQGLHNNGVAKNMQQFRRVITVAINNEWMTKDPFKKYECKIIEPKRVFLTKEELSRIEECHLNSDRLSRCRDVFVFSCYTGLAYADVSKLSRDHLQHINGRDWIILDRTKTKNQSTIPLLPSAVEILHRYRELDSDGDRILPVISSQNLNKYLKEIALLTGINKQLSFHAARHTFATTVTLNQGVDSITTVSAILGHKMIKTTQIYARVNFLKIGKDTEGLMSKD